MRPPSPDLRLACRLLLAATAIGWGGGCSSSRIAASVGPTPTLDAGGGSPGSGGGTGAGGDGPTGGAFESTGGAAGQSSADSGPGDASGTGGASTDADASRDAEEDARPSLPPSLPPSPTPSPSTPACSGLFCEDFEKGMIDPAIWDVQANGSQPPPSLATQAGLVGHGKYAAHFHANPNVVSYDFIITRNPPAALVGHHFGRAYFMVTPMPPANHTEFIYAGTTGFPRYQYLEVASVSTSTWQLTYVDQVPPVTGEDYHSGGKIPLGKWFCLEWEFDDTPDRAVVYVDGVQDFAEDVFKYGGAITGLVGGFAAFGFGYDAWHPATYPFDLYYDDIVLDIKRVGCLE